MAKNNLFRISRREKGYCVTYENKKRLIPPFNSPDFGYLTSTPYHRGSVGYASFPELIKMFIDAPNRLYEGGVVLKFDERRGKGRMKIDDAEKKAIISLAEMLANHVSEIANHESVLTSITKLAQGQR